MTLRVAINGFGRIGRNTLRSLYENGYRDRIEVVAINDLGDTALNAHLLEYDTTHGHFNFSVSHDEEAMYVDGDKIVCLAERDPASLPWKELNVDLVMECTGIFTKREKAALHLEAGAKRVLISGPSADADATVVYGVNEDVLTSDMHIVSNASCTTNCLAPVAKAIDAEIGIVEGLMTTIHSYTNDQNLIDVYHKDPRRARSATHSMIPTKTGAASAVALVLPQLKGKLDGFAVRVPTINVSVVDLSFVPKRATSVEEINKVVTEAAAKSPVLGTNEKPLVSVDFNHNANSSTFDATQTRVSSDGKLVKILAWYDNEWGFSTRMLDNALAMQKFL